jgi:hypothetical protein
MIAGSGPGSRLNPLPSKEFHDPIHSLLNPGARRSNPKGEPAAGSLPPCGVAMAGPVAKTGPAFLIQSNERQGSCDGRGRLILALDTDSPAPLMTAANAPLPPRCSRTLPQSPPRVPKASQRQPGLAGRAVLKGETTLPRQTADGGLFDSTCLSNSLAGTLATRTASNSCRSDKTGHRGGFVWDRGSDLPRRRR